MARYKLIGCKIFEREFASLAYNCKNVIDTTMVRMAIHSKPKRLHNVLQDIIDEFDENAHLGSNDAEYHDFDAILLGYGLCSYVSLGLGSKKYPLVIPRVHDCVALLMGDRAWYDQYYAAHNRTFFGSCGYTECMTFSSEDFYERRYLMYLERYNGNERKARRAADIEAQYTSAYDNFTYIGWDGLDFPEYEQMAKDYADREGWTYEKIQGENTLLKRLLDGDWNEEDFLVVPPGMCIGQNFDGQIMEVVTREEFEAGQ